MMSYAADGGRFLTRWRGMACTGVDSRCFAQVSEWGSINLRDSAICLHKHYTHQNWTIFVRREREADLQQPRSYRDPYPLVKTSIISTRMIRRHAYRVGVKNLLLRFYSTKDKPSLHRDGNSQYLDSNSANLLTELPWFCKDNDSIHFKGLQDYFGE